MTMPFRGVRLSVTLCAACDTDNTLEELRGKLENKGSHMAWPRSGFAPRPRCSGAAFWLPDLATASSRHKDIVLVPMAMRPSVFWTIAKARELYEKAHAGDNAARRSA